MIFRVADDRDLGADLADNFSFGHAVDGVIGSLSVKVRANRTDQFFDRRFVKDGHEIDDTKRSDDLGTLVFRHKRPCRTFQAPSLTVGVYSDNEDIAYLLR